MAVDGIGFQVIEKRLPSTRIVAVEMHDYAGFRR